MKKTILFSILLVFILALTSCGKKSTPTKVGVLKGPTGIGLAKLMEKDENRKNYEFSVFASPDEITPKIISGELDIAAVPSNLASIIYNKTEGKIKVLNINTLGVLYIVSTDDSIKSVEDLRGKTIYASGKGSAPEYILNYILKSNGIDSEKDLTVEYKSEHAEVITAIESNPNAVALLPEPFVTIASIKNADLLPVLDLTKEWEKINNSSALVMGVVIARTEFIEKNPKVIENFLKESDESISVAKFSYNETSDFTDKFGILEKAVAVKAIPKCNLAFIVGEEMQTKLGGFLQVLFEQNPDSVGGKLPDENFYYKK